MKLLLKHLAVSIRRKPLQPFILILTITLALAISVFAFSVRESLSEEISISQNSSYGSADFTVTLNGSSKSRFMFASDAKSLLADRAAVAGVLEAPMLYGEDKKTVFGAAFDFYEIENIFDFEFTEYLAPSHSELDEAAFISREFATENSLSVSDSFTVTVFGKEKSYTVSGITENKLLGSYDVAANISGVTRLMAEDSLFISAIADSFAPSSTLYVSVSEGSSAEECIEILNKEPSFSENSFSDVSSLVSLKANTQVTSAIISVAAVLIALLLAAVIFCCFYILAAERTEENLILSASGASPKSLNILQYAEILVYWLSGTVLGSLLAIPILELFTSLAGFKYTRLSLKPTPLLLGSLLILLVCIICVTLFILSARRVKRSKAEKKKSAYPALISAALFAVCFTALMLIPPRVRMPVYIASILTLFMLLFTACPLLFKSLTRLIAARLDKGLAEGGGRGGVAFKYAVKNAYSVKILHNVSRMTAPLVTIVLSVFLVIGSAHGNYDAAKGLFSADYAVLNATDSCYGKLLECDSLGKTGRTYMSNAALEGGKSTTLISSDNLAMLSFSEELKKAPEGREAIISEADAKMLSLGKNDTLTVNADGREIQLVISDTIKTQLPVLIFDAEEFGISYNMILVSASDGARAEELLMQITDKTALEMAAVISAQELMQQKLDSLDVYLKTGKILIAIGIVFSLIAMVDNLYESYRARREEFELYLLSGASKKSVRRMKLIEILLTAGFGLTVGLLGFALAAISMNSGLLAFGYDTFLNL